MHTMFVDDTHTMPVVCMSRMVVKVDRCDQQKCTICNTHGLDQTIRSIQKLVFSDFDRFSVLTSRSDAYISRSGNFHTDYDAGQA